MEITRSIHNAGKKLGFDLLGIIPVQPSKQKRQLDQWISLGMAGDMDWIRRGQEKREDPRKIFPQAKSIIMVGVSYFTQDIPAELLNDPSRGIIARYAWFDDYHKIVKTRLEKYVEAISVVMKKNVSAKMYVDTGPFLEREFAERAGLGFTGNNTNLINYRTGSYIFLGEILIDIELDSYVNKLIGSCGTCQRCRKSCPTGALVANKVLDARRCISYLTIELKNEIPVEFRKLMKNRIYGCDICQEVCPWNSKSLPTSFQEFTAHEDLIAPSLVDLAKLSAEDFMARFKNSPIKRTKYRGFMRNVAVALGNWGSVEALPSIELLIKNEDEMVAAHAIWAKKQILL
ncbi:MAG: tRNA epoxyqueuosine(34) reductase QueG [Patescibacteria group bacterium]|jgi:epoxyqueuosine reductase